MRLHRIALRGVTRFAESIALDLEALGPGLIALVGRNGEGKSTCLEAVPAALYKSFPSRPGSLYEHAHGRDAFLEAVFDEFGHEVQVRLLIDAEGRKTEGYLFRDGRSLTTGRAAEFEALVEKHFGSRELFLASCFAAQNKAGNFLLMAKKDRKALMIELLGLSYLETLHEAAKKRETVAEGVLVGARLVARTLETELEALHGLEEQLAGARAKVEQVSRDLEDARVAEASATDEVDALRLAGERVESLRKALDAAERGLEAAKAAVADAEDTMRRSEHHAAERLRLLEGQDPAAAEERARDRYAAAVKAIEERRTKLESDVSRAPEIQAAAAEVPELEAELAELERAEAAILVLLGDEKVAAGAAIAAERTWKDFLEARELERKRLVRQGTLLDAVPCTDRETWETHAPDGRAISVNLSAECPLLKDAREARLALDGIPEADPSEVEAARARLQEVRSRLQDSSVASDPIRVQEIRRELPKRRRTAADVDVVERAKTELAGMGELRSKLAHTLESELADVENWRAGNMRERSRIEERLVIERKEAEERIEESRLKAVEATIRRDEAWKDFDEATEATAGRYGVEKRHREAVEARKLAESRLRVADQAAAGLAARVDHLQNKREALEQLRAEVALGELELGDWSLLARALGRDGVQALEIDAAGPEVARLTNELLDACYGARFSISFETLREKKSARGEYSEAFDVQVYDHGHERTVEALSGGERVVVGEAVGLAISIFNARKSGVRWETLFRDETAGALDPANAQAYVQMLRRALSLGGFHQVLFVSHSVEVTDRADVRVFVHDGKVSIDGVPHAQRHLSEETAAAR